MLNMASGRFAQYASNFSRRLKTGGSSLEDDLARITDSSLIIIPEKLFTTVIEETREEHGRKVIMTHLRQRLTDVTKPKAWKRLHAAMVLMEGLMTNASPALLAEIAVGLHFDVVQKLSIVERFQHASNERAQTMVRSKAEVLRSSLVHRLQAFGAQPCKNTEHDDETGSTCSPKGSVAGSLGSFNSASPSGMTLHDFENLFAAISPPLCSRPRHLYDFGGLLEWAEDENSESDSCISIHSSEIRSDSGSEADR